MSVKIGHASIDEHGHAKGGAAGDQTGKEVCIREWYNKGWTFVLRPKKKELAEASAQACEKGCKNGNIGYDQNQRNSLHTEAKKVNYNLSKVGKCETDCSAFMTVCAIAGGAKISYTGNAPTTATMRGEFLATGQYELLTHSKYLNSDAYLKRGDIVVKAGHHTFMALSNGSKANASSDNNNNKLEVAKPTIKKGSNGAEVKKLQKNLNQVLKLSLEIDGICGNLTVAAIKKFQKKFYLTIDGEYGNKTYAKMKEKVK